MTFGARYEAGGTLMEKSFKFLIHRATHRVIVMASFLSNLRAKEIGAL
jgi:hypothetical protein